ncbi:MAG: L-2-amino-thiazoline-4-carboxylic acid hydrolase [Pseudomonadota bacterium]
MSSDKLTIHERMTVQMQYVVPLIRDLQDILGEDVINEALAERLRRQLNAAKQAPSKEADMLRMESDTAKFSAGNALDVEIVKADAEKFDMNVTRCAYAEMMESMNARDIGHLLICNMDFAAAERIGMVLERSQTQMQGADFCDFRYRKKTT